MGAVVTMIVLAIVGPIRFREETVPKESELLARTRTAVGGQLSTFEQMMIRKPNQTLDNAAIIRLWRANVGTPVILQLIKTSNADFDLTANAIIDLKQVGIDETILLAMVAATNRTH